MLKKIILIVLLFSGLLFAQHSVVQTVDLVVSDQIVISSGTLNTSGITTTSIFPSGSKGVITLFVDSVSTSSLGDITVSMELYNEVMDKWATYHSGGDLVTVTAAGLTWPWYIGASEYNAGKIAGDRIRFKLTAASGSAVINAYVRVQ